VAAVVVAKIVVAAVVAADVVIAGIVAADVEASRIADPDVVVGAVNGLALRAWISMGFSVWPRKSEGRDDGQQGGNGKRGHDELPLGATRLATGASAVHLPGCKLKNAATDGSTPTAGAGNLGGSFLQGGMGVPETLYARLGGYDAISAVVDDLLPR